MIAVQEEVIVQIDRAAAIADLLEYYANDHMDEFPDVLRGTIPQALNMLVSEIHGIRSTLVSAAVGVAKEPQP